MFGRKVRARSTLAAGPSLARRTRVRQLPPARAATAPSRSLVSAEAITEQAAMRYVAFLRSELDVIPASHHLHEEYSAQLQTLADRYVLGPRALRS